MKGVKENKEGWEVVTVEHRRDRTWWRMQENRKEGRDMVADGGAQIGKVGPGG